MANATQKTKRTTNSTTKKSPARAKAMPRRPSSRTAKENPARLEAGPTHDQIALRAFHLWQARGEYHGHDVQDWLEAEATLRSEHS